MKRLILALSIILLNFVLIACSMPYKVPQHEFGSSTFPGVSDVLKQSISKTVDVVVVHGMCTHDETWARERIDSLIGLLTKGGPAQVGASTLQSSTIDGIVSLTRHADLPEGRVNITALVWSPLTTPLKTQLLYDQTRPETDCSVEGPCYPKRAKLNGELKDGLLNDCLADALIYQGASKASIRGRMANALRTTIGRDAGTTQGTLTPLVILTDSLGSKVVFDALLELLRTNETLGRDLVNRMAIVFMQANQLPILGLADQIAEPPDQFRGGVTTAPPDSLSLVLRSREEQLRSGGITEATVVAFTDPNDLLSYRLPAARYASSSVKVANVLVSNDETLLGWVERPDTAHIKYGDNPSVIQLITCGNPLSESCRR